MVDFDKFPFRNARTDRRSCDVLLTVPLKPKEIAILVALVLLFVLAIRLSQGNLVPKDLQHLIFR